MNDRPAITAVICTHNRADHLRRAMQSLAKQDMETSAHEVLVVDNASTDETGDVARAFCDSHASFRYVHESTLGLCRARNRAIQEARSPYIAFLDDDAIASPDWLSQILAAFDEAGPSAGCVGGRTLPIWESRRPEWMHDALVNALSVIDWTDEACFLEPPRFVVGANVSYDRSMLLELNGFDERTSRFGTNLMSGDEIELNRRMEAAGRRVYYSPKVCVRHFVSNVRLTMEWHLERAKWAGIGDAMQWLNERERSWPEIAANAAAQIFSPKLPKFIGRALFSRNPQIRFLFRTLLWSKLNYVRVVLGGHRGAGKLLLSLRNPAST